MFENTSLEQYSVLEELASVTPVWRPFVESRSQETEQDTSEHGE
ncbi:hypothetical protein P9250_13145 [Caballeronia sp. LP006]|nr:MULTISPECIES: hypothetical protein [unclassified Caballeronia]MDR5775386.1 hypothetical protein [Caballeronia sp. LZ002]MDR5828828.1 hypothetical protein [Caballeronia sp. LP006]MDR5850824.1 hypothetical protein [Caballeronia sp. LZ003]